MTESRRIVVPKIYHLNLPGYTTLILFHECGLLLDSGTNTKGRFRMWAKAQRIAPLCLDYGIEVYL